MSCPGVDGLRSTMLPAARSPSLTTRGDRPRRGARVHGTARCREAEAVGTDAPMSWEASAAVRVAAARLGGRSTPAIFSLAPASPALRRSAVRVDEPAEAVAQRRVDGHRRPIAARCRRGVGRVVDERGWRTRLAESSETASRPVAVGDCATLGRTWSTCTCWAAALLAELRPDADSHVARRPAAARQQQEEGEQQAERRSTWTMALGVRHVVAAVGRRGPLVAAEDGAGCAAAVPGR